jgi:hypothetical protein
MNDKNFIQITIPFSGFYESVHLDAIDSIVGDMRSDGAGTEALRDVIPYGDVFDLYAQHYVRALSDALLDCGYKAIGASLRYVKVVSPREYNFRTDKIVCGIPKVVLRRLLVDLDVMRCFKSECEAQLQSRGGFHSFYDTDYTTWGDLSDWDSNQCSVLFAGLCAAQFATSYDYEAMWAEEIGGRFGEALIYDAAHAYDKANDLHGDARTVARINAVLATTQLEE